MEHKEYVRISDGSKIAVLFIHGIVGTPNHFSEFVSLVPESISVYNLLLDGHGKGVKDFSKTSMKKWESQVASVVQELSFTHEKIYILAHSLGTLLAIDQAVENKKVCRLFLLAVPLRLSLKPKMTVNSLKVFFDRIRTDDYEALAAKRCYGIEGDKNPFHYIGWIPRYLELFAKIRKTRRVVSLLSTPCMVYLSGKDEMVARSSKKYFENKPNVLINELEKSGHYYYDKGDFDYLLSEFNKMLNVDL
ncbi:MAG: alpha/beta fold hydrolase [Ruminococcus sp.]|nr:alpha/beta fold hydrolase [Ruminococcus sp.]